MNQHHSQHLLRMLLSCLIIFFTLSSAGCGQNLGNNIPSISLPKKQKDAVALSGNYSGAGASSQQSAVQTWIVGFNELQPAVNLSYDPSGSGAGVATFLNGANVWAGSDIPLNNEQLRNSETICHGHTAFDLPDYAAPIAITYNLSSYGLNAKHLHLTAQVIAEIFNGTITNWDSPQIKALNPSIASQLPHLPITPVWRSDKSGTTKNFEEYLAAAAPHDWTKTSSENWSYQAGQGAKGTSGVIQTVRQAEGTIGYADAAQVTSGLGIVAVHVGTNYVLPTDIATSNALSQSTILPSTTGRVIVSLPHTTTVANTYPIDLVSYAIACPVYTNNSKAEFVKQWLTYIDSVEGQDAAHMTSGSVPLSHNIRTKVMETIQSIRVVAS